jgi:hypothetical protein
MGAVKFAATATLTSAAADADATPHRAKPSNSGGRETWRVNVVKNVMGASLFLKGIAKYSN